MVQKAHNLKIAKAILSTPQLVRAKPSINWFFCNYLRKFRVMDVGGNLIVHSHLAPLNSKAYSRFINEHLLSKSIGPSHAQIGITNACPQHCDYCYNKNRTGRVMDKETILKTIRELKNLGVFWLGLTGGEPLLNKDIVDIVETASDNCAVKLFTTGCTLTKQLAADLKHAGLFSVAISLDHWQENLHDQVRNYKGAFQTALAAIDTFKNTDGIHVSVSAVLSKDMLRQETVETYLEFLRSLDIHEVWLSEAKPSVTAYQQENQVITQAERTMLIDLQNRYNKMGGMTINYLGHFEDARHFGCSAGHKIVYVDAFGDVSPCVFIPMTFGNVNETSITDIYHAMLERFPTENTCFINKNYKILQKYMPSNSSIQKDDALKVIDEVEFGPLPKFFKMHYS
ncbi:radical SAM protein [candidate division KSB1 bacterium]|nr:radical SAM protein [candidate division KSB1 bacterium]